jgi:molybdenum cofactor biosynthesis protein B
VSQLTVATVTVSDTRTAADDVSGQRLVTLLSAAGLRLSPHRILADDPAVLRAFVESLPGAADAAILSGGTGIAPRDVTCETLEACFEKRLDGFGEAFRRLSWEQIGARAVLSRATAGIFRGVVIFSLPGSPAAVELGLTQLVLPIVRHAVDLAQGRTGH